MQDFCFVLVAESENQFENAVIKMKAVNEEEKMMKVNSKKDLLEKSMQYLLKNIGFDEDYEIVIKEKVKN